MKKFYIFLFSIVFFASIKLNAQNAWYDNAQHRIDSLRKDNFTIKVVDNLGNPVSDSVKILHKKHEFPWGTAYDLSYYNSYGSSGLSSTTSAITSKYSDAEVYKTNRNGKYLCYNFSSVASKTYNITLKFAEITLNSANTRIFDVFVNGTPVIRNVDIFNMAGGRFIALDTTVQVIANSNKIKVELSATLGIACVNAITVDEITGSTKVAINCGGQYYTGTRTYNTDDAYFNTTNAALISSNDDWYKALMLKYCNYGVCGNQFKWSGIEPTKGVLNYAPFEKTFNWYKSVGFEMRAHTLLWGGTSKTDYHAIPQWVMALASTPTVMYDTCRNRVVREVNRYKGQIKEYDVINEPTHAKYLQSVVGEAINWECFKWAHEADPDARLFVNDYNIIEWQDQTNTFVALVQKMLQNGAPVTGIGAQCHIGSSVDIANFKTRFDQLGSLGLPVKITEFDMGAKSLSEKKYAAEIAKMMRLAFSHPSIEGFIFWGLTEPTWVPESIINLVREDKTVKLAADSLYHLVHEVWTTKINDITDAEGLYTFNGYHGDYDILVKNEGKWEQFSASCLKANKDAIFELKLLTGKPTSPCLKNVRIKEPNQIELTFDKKMTDPNPSKNNFRIFDNKLNYINAIALKENDSTTIVLTCQTNILDRDYIQVSYAPGTLKTKDGALLEAFGPILRDSLANPYLSAKTSKNGKNIQIAFDRKLITESLDANNFLVKLNNANNTVTNAYLSTSQDTLYLDLSTQIKKNTDRITVSYLSGNLKTESDKFVTAFVSKNMVNKVIAPKFVSAITNTTGTSITVTTDQYLAAIQSQTSSFQVTAGGEIIAITGVTLYAADKRKFVIGLSSPITKGDSVIITYTPGNIQSAIGVPVPNFFAGVTNNSTNLDIRSIETDLVKFFPNPFSNILCIENNADFTSVSISDITGKVIISQDINSFQKNTINTENLKNGVYMVVLKNENKKIMYKVVKQ